MKAIAILPWIPVFPLIGFLVNGLLYLVSHAKLGGKDAPKGPHGDAHGDAHGSVAHDDHGHGGHHEIPFAAAHAVIGPAATILVLPRGVRRDLPLVGRDARPRGRRRDDVDVDADGRESDLVRRQDARRRRGVPARRALGAHARIRHVRRLPHPRLLGRVHGTRPGVRPLLLVPEPLHVLDAHARPRREPADPVRGLGGRRALLVPPDRLLLEQGLRRGRRQEGVRREPHRRLRLRPRDLRLLRALRRRPTSARMFSLAAADPGTVRGRRRS